MKQERHQTENEIVGREEKIFFANYPGVILVPLLLTLNMFHTLL